MTVNYAVEIDNLSKRYADGTSALVDVKLTISEGDFYALLGANGAGKSSLIGILSSLVRKTSGKVKIFGLDIDTDFAQARQLLGVTPQDFNFSIFEKPIEVLLNQAGYYGIVRKDCLEHVESCLRKLDLWDKRNATCQHLSGGMKRRLMIARALVHKPRLLILDEPTAGVDIEIRRNIHSFLREMNENGTTIVLTTHYLEEAEKLCNYVGLLDRGKLIKQCSMHEMLAGRKLNQLILELKEPCDHIESLDGFKLELAKPDLLLVGADPSLDLQILFAHLKTQNIGISDIRQKSNRLEELLLSSL